MKAFYVTAAVSAPLRRPTAFHFLLADADPPEAIRKLTDTCRDILADLALEDIATDVARGKWQEHFDKESYAKQFLEFYYRYVNAKTP